MDDILLRALVAGLAVALMAGPLGCFVVWRRMAYFGDTLAHSALLGIALGILLNVNLNLAIALFCLLIATLLTALQQQRQISTDTLLGIMAHSSLALGVITVSTLDHVRIDLTAYLFGDLLAISSSDLYWVLASCVGVYLVLARFWRTLISITVDEELAQIEGQPAGLAKALLTLMLSVVIAVAMKVVGVLLITSLLIIPAAAARRLSHSPEMMALLASIIGCIAVGLGLSTSYWWDSPAGPTIVVASALLFTGVFVATLRQEH